MEDVKLVVPRTDRLVRRHHVTVAISIICMEQFTSTLSFYFLFFLEGGIGSGAGACESVVVKALCYKSEGRGFES
jgi:hypothetical protein